MHLYELPRSAGTHHMQPKFLGAAARHGPFRDRGGGGGGGGGGSPPEASQLVDRDLRGSGCPVWVSYASTSAGHTPMGGSQQQRQQQQCDEERASRAPPVRKPRLLSPQEDAAPRIRPLEKETAPGAARIWSRFLCSSVGVLPASVFTPPVTSPSSQRASPPLHTPSRACTRTARPRRPEGGSEPTEV
ncbi:unnamed protein product [Pleuronectes platessa]|uniref:Uncharacterized protein n=1 Tax=Pleuronectes platessa TaxID=8262 RepID=A0A9N7VPS8_PLEPL|nr:unnamed protein product [Pleuronectes platessa]